MAKTLKMTFVFDDDKKMTVNIAEPKDDITKAEVDAVGQLCVSKQALVSGGLTVQDYEGAVIREVTETALA